MKKSSDQELRNEIIGLGKNSIRKNYYRSLLEQKRILEEKNCQLEEEIQRRVKVEQALESLNVDLERRISERTLELEDSNAQLSETLEQLEKTYDFILEAEKMASLNHLVIGISHELNTPIGTSLTTGTYLKGILKDIQLDLTNHSISKKNMEQRLTSMENGLNLMIEAMKSSADLVSNFKQVTDMQHRSLKRFKIKDAIMFVLKSFKSDFTDFKTVDLSISCDDQLIVKSDVSMFTQLLNVFISNTLQHGFGQEGGRISIEFTETGASYNFVYADDGHGMSQETAGHIFEPFFTTSLSGHSSGLGLYTAYNLVKSIGGEIQLETHLNGGTSFYVDFPKI